MKKILLVILLILGIQLCESQQKNNPKNAKHKNPIEKKINNSMNTKKDLNTNKITEANFVDKIMERVENYDKQPMYIIRLTKNNCLLEILVNGHIVHENYELSNLATPVLINYAILKSGKQSITYRLYPIGNLMKELDDKFEEVNILEENTSLAMDIIKIDDWKTYEWENEKVILTVETSTKDGKFIGSNLPYYEHTLSFDAKVPYVNEGWHKGLDLRKLDQKELENKLLAYYKQIQEYYLNKDIDKILETSYPSCLNDAISMYYDRSKVQRIKNELIEWANSPKMEFIPLKGYQMQITDNGRLVTLRFPTLNAYDERLNGAPAFSFTYEEENEDISLRSTDLYFYVSEDEYKKTGKIKLTLF